MVNKCVVFGCKSGYQLHIKRNSGTSSEEQESSKDAKRTPIFPFPFDTSDVNQRWIRFVNRKDWKPTKHSGSRVFARNTLKVNMSKLEKSKAFI